MFITTNRYAMENIFNEKSNNIYFKKLRCCGIINVSIVLCKLDVFYYFPRKLKCVIIWNRGSDCFSFPAHRESVITIIWFPLPLMKNCYSRVNSRDGGSSSNFWRRKKTERLSTACKPPLLSFKSVQYSMGLHFAILSCRLALLQQHWVNLLHEA
jgi:hypothetical protein